MASNSALARIGFRAFAPAPEDVDLGAKFHAQVDGFHGFLHGVSADFRIVAGESAILENRIAKQVGGCHRNDQTGIREGLAEILFDGLGFGRGGIDGDQVVVVKVDAIRANFAEQVDQFGRGFGLAHFCAKWITTAIVQRSTGQK